MCMPTYKQIQDFVRERFGFVPKRCWIADVLRSLGLITQIARNRIDTTRVKHPCPKARRHTIIAALRHFGILPNVVVAITALGTSQTVKRPTRSPSWPDRYRDWLEGDAPAGMLKPYKAGEMEAVPVSRAVNSPKNDTEACIEPLTEREGVP